MMPSSETLPVCLECLRSGKEVIAPVIVEAHRHSRRLFQLVDQPPQDASGKSCTICVNGCRIPEGEWDSFLPSILFQRYSRDNKGLGYSLQRGS